MYTYNNHLSWAWVAPMLQPIGEDIGEDEFYAFLVLLQKEETMEPHGFKLAWTKVKDISERCKFST